MKSQLHTGAKWFFRFRGYFSFLVPLIVLFVFSLNNLDLYLYISLKYLFVILVILIIISAEIYARMSYKLWFYEFTNTELKLERGIIWKKYSNIPYERIQNVDITRGVIARIFEFSSVNIQTAGYSVPTARWGNLHSSEGFIPAVSVDEAEKIRSLVLKKISKKSKSGL